MEHLNTSIILRYSSQEYPKFVKDNAQGLIVNRQR